MTHPIIFFGTSEFATPSLEAFIRDGRFDIRGVVTRPDRPVGRHAVMTPPAVKRLVVETLHAAFRKDVIIKQPEKLQEEPFASWIREYGPTCDVFVVVSYGKILPQWLLDLPKRGVINIHGSLLPRWRGPSPIQAAIAAGDELTGVTIMKLEAEMDYGPILAQAKDLITLGDTGGSLHDRLALLGAKIFPDALAAYLDGKLTPVEQDHSRATYCKILTREDGQLDVTKTAAELERLIRAYNPWPGTWMGLDGKRIKVHHAIVSPTSFSASLRQWGSGARFISNGLPAVVCGDGMALEFARVQLEGKKEMSGKEFLKGNRFTTHSTF